jgi:hypothetical protein
VHIALVGRTRAAIELFHRAALEAGGRDEGAPGPRPHYGPHYFGAFVRDVDGNKLEAVLVTAPVAARAKKAKKKAQKKTKKKTKKKSRAAKGGKLAKRAAKKSKRGAARPKRR